MHFSSILASALAIASFAAAVPVCQAGIDAEADKIFVTFFAAPGAGPAGERETMALTPGECGTLTCILFYIMPFHLLTYKYREYPRTGCRGC